MPNTAQPHDLPAWPTISGLPIPVKVLLSSLLLTLALAMVGALGQIIVHDIIPTFFSDDGMTHDAMETVQDEKSVPGETDGARGDLFDDDISINPETAEKSLMENDQFIWTLRWTHIHLFGMSMIFIFLGAVTVFLDISDKTKSGLVALPFFGVVVDIAAMWLKAFVSPVFFWLHIPGGGLFVGIFIFVFFRAMREMWGVRE